MKNLTPQIIADITNGTYVGKENERNVQITGAVRDNRDVKPRNLFVCIRGARTDGHQFAEAAYESGASCCLAEQEIKDAKGPYIIVKSTLDAIKTIGGYYRSIFNIPVIGITGSVGKTTAKEIIAAVLGEKFNVLKTEMNLNNELGVPLTLLSLNEQHEVAVIEMGISDFGEMSRLAEMVRPDIFVMTKIGYAHIEELGDLQGVLRAKTEAFDYMKKTGTAVLNGDDELLLSYDPGMKKKLFGLGKQNDIRAENVSSDSLNSTTMEIVSKDSRFPIKLNAYGSHLAALAPAAAVIGQLLGMTDKEMEHGFSSYTPVDGRSRVTSTDGIILIDDCYNANPNSVKAALTSLTTLPGRHVVILGDMLSLGEHSINMHKDIGEYAARRGVDLLLCHGELSRCIYESFISAGGCEAYHFPLMNELKNEIPRKIKKDDAILVKASRGMHFEELLPVISELKVE